MRIGGLLAPELPKEEKEMSPQTTDELVRIIAEDIGSPLPTYNRGYKKYVVTYPNNINIGNGVIGIKSADIFDTFREACISIINQNK